MGQRRQVTLKLLKLEIVDVIWLTLSSDLLPTPIEKRTWLWYNYFNFYFSLSMDNWTLGSTMIGIGLSWWQAIIAIFVAQLISSIAMCINSRVGETYHIGYPIVCRAVFGVYGAYYYVAARAVLAVVYYSIKCKSTADGATSNFRSYG
jgi:NCS1 family nucleobase:cation symporter-1